MALADPARHARLATTGSSNVSWHFGLVLVRRPRDPDRARVRHDPRAHWHDVGFGLLVASYVLDPRVRARNLVLRGMGIVFIGIACNALVITLNQGMPVKIPAEWQNKSWAQPTVKHHPQQPDDKLRFLSDIIVVKEPVRHRCCQLRRPHSRRRPVRRRLQREPKPAAPSPPGMSDARDTLSRVGRYTAARAGRAHTVEVEVLGRRARTTRGDRRTPPVAFTDDFMPKAHASHRS